jgi:hypothetical protein
MNVLKPIIRIIILHADGSVTELTPDQLSDFKLQEGDQVTLAGDNGQRLPIVEVLRDSDDLLVVLEGETAVAINGFFLVEAVKLSLKRLKTFGID